MWLVFFCLWIETIVPSASVVIPKSLKHQLSDKTQETPVVTLSEHGALCLLHTGCVKESEQKVSPAQTSA